MIGRSGIQRVGFNVQFFMLIKSFIFLWESFIIGTRTGYDKCDLFFKSFIYGCMPILLCFIRFQNYFLTMYSMFFL